MVSYETQEWRCCFQCNVIKPRRLSCRRDVPGGGRMDASSFSRVLWMRVVKTINGNRTENAYWFRETTLKKKPIYFTTNRVRAKANSADNQPNNSDSVPVVPGYRVKRTRSGRVHRHAAQWATTTCRLSKISNPRIRAVLRECNTKSDTTDVILKINTCYFHTVLGECCMWYRVFNFFFS